MKIPVSNASCIANKLNAMVFKAELSDKSIFLVDKGSHCFDSLLSYSGLRPVQINKSCWARYSSWTARNKMDVRAIHFFTYLAVQREITGYEGTCFLC